MLVALLTATSALHSSWPLVRSPYCTSALQHQPRFTVARLSAESVGGNPSTIAPVAPVPWTVPSTAATIEKLRARTPLRDKKAKKHGGMNRDGLSADEVLVRPERLSTMAKLDELAKQESEYHRMLVELPPDISQLNAKTSALEATLSELQAALTILNEERTRLVGSLAATQQELEEELGLLESAKSALVQMQSARETAQLTLQALRTEGRTLRDSSRSLEISMAELQLELASSRAERDELAATEQRLEEELASAKRALHEQHLARQRCERLRSMVDESRHLVDESRGSLAQSEAEMAALSLEVAAIEAEASVIRAQKAEAARELDRMADLHAHSRAEVRDRDQPRLLELELNWELPSMTRLVRHGIKDVTVCDEARAFLGLYKLDEGVQVNGAPIWLHCEDRQRCIAFNREHGLWHAQQRSEAGAACGFFYRRCESGQCSPHLSPHAEGSSWFLYTGNARTGEHSWLEDGVRCVVWSRLSAARVQTSSTEKHVSLES
jgi:hypothetical protein